MGGGASRWCRAAKKVGFPCVCFFNEDSPRAAPPHSTIYCSAKSAPAGNDDRKQTEEPAPKTLADKSLCAICLEPLSSSHGGDSGSGSCNGSKTSGETAVFTAQCTHAFHFPCIASNIRHGSVTCPICRAHWSHLPRELTTPPSCNSSDPVLRILDDSIATSRVNRRSFLRSTRYNDDDPVDPEDAAEPRHPRLHFAVIPAPTPPAINGNWQCARFMPLQLHSSSSPTTRGQQTRSYLTVKLAHQPATDLVLVASPNGPHLRLLKQSMALAVFSLRPVDRLAIVTYSATASRAFPLRRMSFQGKRAALQVIDRLRYLGEAEPTEGLRKGVKILDDRAHHNPLSCILHLSDSPTRSYVCSDLQFPIPIHRFHIGFRLGMSNGLVMHELEEFLAKLLGGVIRDTQLRLGEDGGWVRLGELRGGEERRIPVDLTPAGECGFMQVSYSYVEGGAEQRLTNGECVVGIEEKSECRDGQCEFTSSDNPSIIRGIGIGGSSSCVERWDYLDPFMARRWAKHLHGYKA